MGTPSMMLLSSASEQNVFFTYVCLVGSIKPTENPTTSSADHSQLPFNVIDNEGEEIDLDDDDMTMRVERSQALHEIIQREHNQDIDKLKNFVSDCITEESTTTELLHQTESEAIIESNECNPKILELTRMRWLSESHDGSPDASPALLSPTESTTSCERDITEPDTADKYLSTILRLDKEHNLFGLSNIAIVGSKISSKKSKKGDDKAVFHQTAIVQVCYPSSCCRNKSNTQLPASLRCNRCGVCCTPYKCSSCVAPSCTSFCRSCCPPARSCCPPAKSTCPPMPSCGLPSVIWTGTCPTDCGYGLEIRVNKKQKFEPIYPEKEARSPCILHKPLAARSCHHIPRCLPPASCCDAYIMPCYWPGRVTAPCCEPDHCFHNPPCRRPRVPHSTCRKEKCPYGGCEGKCENMCCLGRNEALKTAMEAMYGGKPQPPPPKQQSTTQVPAKNDSKTSKTSKTSK